MTISLSSVRSPTEAYDRLVKDVALRKQELVNLRAALGGSSARSSFLSRSALLLAYSHVEGATKTALAILFGRLNGSGLTWKSVDARLLTFEIDWRLRRISLSGMRRLICDDETTVFLRTSQDRRIQVDIDGMIGNIGTPNAVNMRTILAACGIDPNRYETELEFLDDRQLSRRHELAHGSLRPVDLSEARDAVDRAMTLLEFLLTDFGNLLVLETYRNHGHPSAEVS